MSHDKQEPTALATLTNMKEILLRQIHPSYIESGNLSSQPFRPTSKDDNKLSVDRSSIFTAEQSYKHYTAELGFESVGVYGLSVGEFQGETIGCVGDPLEEDNTRGTKANPAHSLADYSVHNASQQKNVAKRLKRLAAARGCLHPVPAGTADKS